MGFEGLTSGERKRLQQGILSPEEASLVSARSVAKGGGGGFWSSTWGQVIRGVGIAALNFIPAVGGIASQALAAYDKARFTELQKKANSEYAAELQKTQAAKAAEARRTVPAPVLDTLPGPWAPDWGPIGVSGGSQVYTSSGQAPGLLEEIQAGFGEFQSWQWWALAIAAGLVVFIFARGGR